MPVFNPSPGPANDPNYLNYSKVVAQPEADMSGKIALSTAGEGIAGATAITDELIKKNIQDTTYKKIDTERDQFTSGLEKVKAQLDNGVIAPPNSAGSTGNWLDANDSADVPDLPVGLESGLSRIQQLTLAKQQGAIKLNDTQYAQNVLAVAKQLRSQYGPGYRDYIDQEVSKASGLPVANSYYQNLMMDINRQMMQLGQKKDQTGDLMVWGLKEGVPHMDTYIQQRANNDPNYQGDGFVLHQIQSWQNLKAQQGIDAANRAETKDNLDTQKVKETQNLTRNLNNLVSHHIEDNLALSGMKSIRDNMQFIDDARAGKISTTDAEVRERAGYLQAYRNYLFQEGIKMAQGPGAIIGMDAAVKQVNDALAPIDGYIDSAMNKDTGTAFAHLHANQAIDADTENQWLISHDRGFYARNIKAARGLMGDQLAEQIVGPMLAAAKDKAFGDLFQQEAVASVGDPTDAKGNPQPRYIKDAIQHGKEVGAPEDFNGTVVNWVNRITDPQMPLAGKDKLVDWAFNPKNIGLLNEFKMDYRDPNTGQMVPGKYRALNIMASDGMSRAIAEASRYHPENYQKYQNFGESEFQSLYRQDLQTLNKLSSNPDIDVHYSFDDTSNHFGLTDRNGVPVTRENAARSNIFKNKTLSTDSVPMQRFIQNTFDIMDRVNGGIDRIKTIQVHNPEGQSSENSTSKYLLDTVASTLNNEPNNMAARAMGRAIIKAKNPEMEQKELDQRFLKAGLAPGVNIP